MLLEFVLFALGATIITLLLRIAYLLYKIWLTDNILIQENKSLRTMLCVGSGGHTSELIRIIRSLNRNKYYPRHYIMADNDVSSEVKIHKLEQEYNNSNYVITRIPRSRNVMQSYYTSILTTLYSICYTLPIVFKSRPDVILCNGPGTCIPVCFIAFLMKVLFLNDCRIIFVESICRVRSLSLSGKMLTCFADVIAVQWPFLLNVCYRAKYFGRLT